MYNSQPGVGIRLDCDMSFAQYMVLKKGPLPLYLFTSEMSIGLDLDWTGSGL